MRVSFVSAASYPPISPKSPQRRPSSSSLKVCPALPPSPARFTKEESSLSSSSPSMLFSPRKWTSSSVRTNHQLPARRSTTMTTRIATSGSGSTQSSTTHFGSSSSLFNPFIKSPSTKSASLFRTSTTRTFPISSSSTNNERKFGTTLQPGDAYTTSLFGGSHDNNGDASKPDTVRFGWGCASKSSTGSPCIGDNDDSSKEQRRAQFSSSIPSPARQKKYAITPFPSAARRKSLDSRRSTPHPKCAKPPSRFLAQSNESSKITTEYQQRMRQIFRPTGTMFSPSPVFHLGKGAESLTRKSLFSDSDILSPASTESKGEGPFDNSSPGPPAKKTATTKRPQLTTQFFFSPESSATTKSSETKLLYSTDRQTTLGAVSNVPFVFGATSQAQDKNSRILGEDSVSGSVVDKRDIPPTTESPFTLGATKDLRPFKSIFARTTNSSVPRNISTAKIEQSVKETETRKEASSSGGEAPGSLLSVKKSRGSASPVTRQLLSNNKSRKRGSRNESSAASTPTKSEISELRKALREEIRRRRTAERECESKAYMIQRQHALLAAQTARIKQLQTELKEKNGESEDPHKQVPFSKDTFDEEISATPQEDEESRSMTKSQKPAKDATSLQPPNNEVTTTPRRSVRLKSNIPEKKDNLSHPMTRRSMTPKKK